MKESFYTIMDDRDYFCILNHEQYLNFDKRVPHESGSAKTLEAAQLLLERVNELNNTQENTYIELAEKQNGVRTDIATDYMSKAEEYSGRCYKIIRIDFIEIS